MVDQPPARRSPLCRLLGRAVCAHGLLGTENGPFSFFAAAASRSGLSDHFAAKRPYDEIVHEADLRRGHLDRQTGRRISSPRPPKRQGQSARPDPPGRPHRAGLSRHADRLPAVPRRQARAIVTSATADAAQRHAGRFPSAGRVFRPDRSSACRRSRRQKAVQDTNISNADNEAVDSAQGAVWRRAFCGHGTRREQLARWVTHPQQQAVRPGHGEPHLGPALRPSRWSSRSTTFRW